MLLKSDPKEMGRSDISDLNEDAIGMFDHYTRRA